MGSHSAIRAAWSRKPALISKRPASLARNLSSPSVKFFSDWI
jgi:hypothetical protein